MPLSISAFFLTDSQWTLALLITAPAFLQLKSFWDIWAPLRLPFLSCSFKFSSGYPVMLDSSIMNWQTHLPKPKQHLRCTQSA